MEYGKIINSEFKQQYIYSKLIIGMICILGQILYSTYYFQNEKGNPDLYGAIGVLCDKTNYDLFKLTQFWAYTLRFVFIAVLIEQFIKEKNHVDFKKYTPSYPIKTFISKFILFTMNCLLFHIIFSIVLSAEIHFFVRDLQWNSLAFSFFQYHLTHLVEFSLYTSSLFLIAFWTRKYLILMTILILLFSFNVKIPFLIGHSNMEILKNKCLPNS